MNLPEEWTTDTVRANGVELQYYRVGDGPPLVVAHGIYDNGRCWSRLADDLADQFDVVTYDARAHGRSEAPATGYAVEDRVADLVGLVDALDLDDPVLFGHSMGGTTVARTATTHPDLPRAVVLVDPVGMLDAPDATPDERAEHVREQVREWSNTSIEEIAAEYDHLDSDLARNLATARRECRPEIAEISREGFPPSAETFPEIDCPTLVLKADADPRKRAEELALADELTEGRLVHVPDAGHTVFRDEYDAAYAELRAFLHRL